MVLSAARRPARCLVDAECEAAPDDVDYSGFMLEGGTWMGGTWRGEWEAESGRRPFKIAALSLSAFLLFCCFALQSKTGFSDVVLAEKAGVHKAEGPRDGKTFHGNGRRGRKDNNQNSNSKTEAGQTMAQQMKEKSEREDKQSRSLRMQANKGYDEAHELMRKAGVVTHSFARITKAESGLKSLLEQDKRDVVADVRSLSRVGALKREIAKAKIRAAKARKAEQDAQKVMSASRVRLVRDKGRESDQHNNVAKLLKDAAHYADEAESSLKKSQVLQLNTVSSTGDANTAEAAADFQGAGTEKRLSSTMTRKALDARSKARLGQEYVVMLKTLVARDKTQKLLDKKAAREARRKYSQHERKLSALEKQEAELKVGALKADESEHLHDEHTQSRMIAADAKLLNTRQRMAKREQVRAMRLLHTSHKLQAKAASLLDASTKDIEAEENAA